MTYDEFQLLGTYVMLFVPFVVLIRTSIPAYLLSFNHIYSGCLNHHISHIGEGLREPYDTNNLGKEQRYHPALF